MMATHQSHLTNRPHHNTPATDGRSSANHRLVKLTRRNCGKPRLFISLAICSSFLTMAAASPVPDPSPAARSRHSTHRLPPISGSIFGKRSLEALVNSHTNTKQSDRLLKLEEQLLKRRQSQHQQHQPEDKTQSPNYQDIITELIEDFMALNNESNPEEATAAFCRMIVYECQQMLSSKSRSSVSENNEKNRR